MRISIFCFLLIGIFACETAVPRRPVSHHGKSFIKESIERNKKINELEKRAIKQYIAKDSTNQYFESSSGFWYRYITKVNDGSETPNAEDKVVYKYQISNLRDEILYSFNDLDEVTYIIDKEDVELGIQSGIKLMRKGEDVVFVFPSYNALGLLGDKEKIGINEPLIYRIQLLEIN